MSGTISDVAELGGPCGDLLERLWDRAGNSDGGLNAAQRSEPLAPQHRQML